MNSEKGTLIGIQNASNYFLTLKKAGKISHERIIEVDFSPVVAKDPTSSKLRQRNILKSYPIFNNDGKIYMPSFIIPAEQENNQEHQKIYALLHKRKLIESLEEKEEIFIAKPSKKNSCCCVCKVVYDDYLTHLSSLQHQSKTNISPFNQDIAELCALFNPVKRNQSFESLSNGEDYNEKPIKKIKIQKQQRIKNNHQSKSTVFYSSQFMTNQIATEAAV